MFFIKVLPKMNPPKNCSTKVAYNKALSKVTKELETKIKKAVKDLETTNLELL